MTLGDFYIGQLSIFEMKMQLHSESPRTVGE